MLRLCLPSAVLAAALTACGGSASVSEAARELATSLDAGHYAEVLKAAPALLARADAEGAAAGMVWKIELLQLDALALTGEAEPVLAQLDELSSRHPEKVDALLYLRAGRQVFEAPEGASEAVEVLHAGVSRFPTYAEKYDRFIEEILESGDEDALGALRALGYLGGG